MMCGYPKYMMESREKAEAFRKESEESKNKKDATARDKIYNVFKVTVTGTIVKESLWEVWDELEKLNLLRPFREVKIEVEDKFKRNAQTQTSDRQENS